MTNRTREFVLSYLGAEAAEKCEPKVAKGEGKVLVEKISEEFAHPVMEKTLVIII